VAGTAADFAHTPVADEGGEAIEDGAVERLRVELGVEPARVLVGDAVVVIRDVARGGPGVLGIVHDLFLASGLRRARLLLVSPRTCEATSTSHRRCQQGPEP